MVKKRLIPKLLIVNRQFGKIEQPVLVTTVGYSGERQVGDPVSQAKIYESQLVDELMVLNINSVPLDANQVFGKLLDRLATETFMPLTVGGGVRTVENFAMLLESGADKVSINTAALRRPDLISEAAHTYGAQCVVVSIDVRNGRDGGLEVVSDRGRVFEGRDPVAWACEAVDRGAGEIILTDVDHDGSGAGLNLTLCRAVADAVNVPVIISGGCGISNHFVEGFLDGHAEGVAAGTFFCFRDQNPMQTRSHIANAGVPIRLLT
ncbi:MAG: imidazole glycerol phosphate synthase subunit HisF [Paracoccaceae bacterium]